MSVEEASPQREFDVPVRFVPGVRAVEALAAEARYLAALVFGSVADVQLHTADARMVDVPARVLLIDDHANVKVAVRRRRAIGSVVEIH